MSTVTFDQLNDRRKGRFGVLDVPCPGCGPERRTAVNRNRKTMRLWCDSPDRITYHCARCGVRGWAMAERCGATNAAAPDRDVEKIKADIATREVEDELARRRKVLAIWRRGKPARTTVVETYLRWRGYHGLIQPTIRFMPASRGYAAAMVAAFGFAQEIEPGILAIHDQDVVGVHITALRSDGLGKAGTERDKIMFGRSIGTPIVVAPPNDGLGLAICEGLEDGLSIFESTGLGVWAAGSASRLPALADAVPIYVGAVTVVADDDDTGRTNAQKLADALAHRQCDVRVIVPQEERAA